MKPEQKQQAKQLIADWTNVSRTSTPAVWFLNGDCMSALLQELIDAPEPDPVGYTNETELDYVRTYESLPVSGAFWPTSDEDACVALYAAPPANNQSEQHLEMVNPLAPSVPVLTVECEPDYWSGGHYHEGSMPHIDPTAVWKLPIGTELYTAPPAPSVPDADLVRDAERYRWLKCERFDKPYAVTNENMTAVYEGDELDAVIDAAIAAEKGGA